MKVLYVDDRCGDYAATKIQDIGIKKVLKYFKLKEKDSKKAKKLAKTWCKKYGIDVEELSEPVTYDFAVTNKEEFDLLISHIGELNSNTKHDDYFIIDDVEEVEFADEEVGEEHDADYWFRKHLNDEWDGCGCRCALKVEWEGDSYYFHDYTGVEGMNFEDFRACIGEVNRAKDDRCWCWKYGNKDCGTCMDELGCDMGK